MNSRSLTVFAAAIIIVAAFMAVYAASPSQITPIPEDQTQYLVPPTTDRTLCQLTSTDNSPGWYASTWVAGDRYVDFHNPAECGTPPIYPFEVLSLDISLYDDGAVTWPCTLAVVVFEADLQGTLPDTCWYPGVELCRQVFIPDQALFTFPALGTVTFDDPCCVDGPIFVGIEYVGVGAVQWPSPLFDTQVVDTCDVWVDMGGTDWVILHQSVMIGAGYPLWWVNGDTDSPNCLPDTCNWQPGDPHKMHFPQLPDTTGWDVNATWPVVLADDWECSETGWVKDIHFWGSWRDGNQGNISQFLFSIHEDIPAGTICVDTTWATGDANNDGFVDVSDIIFLADYLFGSGPAPDPLWTVDMNGDCVIDQIDVDWLISGLPAVPACCTMADYSMPGELLWQAEISPGQFDATPFDPPTEEGWYDPATDDVRWNNHNEYFQYDVCLDSFLWFPQDSGTIYWLNISAMVTDPLNTSWGWKSTQDHWNDDAVWDSMEQTVWQDLYEPGGGSWDTLINHFWVLMDEQGMVLDGHGEDAYGDGWYYYPWYDWWNIWFYDHPFDSSRYKTGVIELDIFPWVPGPMWVEIAVNWSTDNWAYMGDPERPPMPGEDEDLFIGREVLFAGDFVEGHFSLPYEIPMYNPEWVSIDIRGFNFVIPEGFIIHECRPKNPGSGQSLDLSFVITGEPGEVLEGACCDTVGTCFVTTAADCAAMGGLWEGSGTTCTPNPCDTCDFQNPGDLDGDGARNIVDLSWLVEFLYNSGPPPYNMANADVNGDCCIDWRDVHYYINYLFLSGPPPVDCTCINPPVCVDAPIPYTPGTVYHNVNRYTPGIGAPTGSLWHELHPNFGTDWTLSNWLDNGDGYLSFCDTIVLLNAADTIREHVIKVMPTMTLIDTLTGDTVYMDLIDPPNPMVLPMGDALGSQWHQVYPNYCRTYQLVYWPGVFLQTAPAVGDEIWMYGLDGPDSTIVRVYILLAIETDIITETLSCCETMGDVDGVSPSTSPDIADLIYLVTYMFQNGPPPGCDEPYLPDCPVHYYVVADVNGDGTCVPDIADLIYLVTYMFQNGPLLVPCP